MYRCFAPGCAKASKLWPRLDNFKQHLIRMHPIEDVEALVKRYVGRLARALHNAKLRALKHVSNSDFLTLADPNNGTLKKKADLPPC